MAPVVKKYYSLVLWYTNTEGDIVRAQSIADPDHGMVLRMQAELTTVGYQTSLPGLPVRKPSRKKASDAAHV